MTKRRPLKVDAIATIECSAELLSGRSDLYVFACGLAVTAGSTSRMLTPLRMELMQEAHVLHHKERHVPTSQPYSMEEARNGIGGLIMSCVSSCRKIVPSGLIDPTKRT